MKPPSGLPHVRPGIYSDGETVVIDIPKMLRAHGFAVTPENVAMMTRVAEDLVREVFPDVPMEVVD